MSVVSSIGISEHTSSTIAPFGTYTPTAANNVNLDANPTMYVAQYFRVGNTVTVSGRFTANPTAAVSTSFTMTLPIASNFANAEELGGVAFAPAIAGQGAAIYATSSNIDQQQLTHSADFNYHNNGTTKQSAQSWTSGVGVTAISQIDAWLYRVGNPSGNITLSVYLADVNDKPSGSVLGSKAIAMSGITTDTAGASYSFTFASPITISASTKYVFVLVSDNGDGSNYIAVLSDFPTAGYANGKSGSSSDGGSSWTMYTTSDLYFITYLSGVQVGKAKVGWIAVDSTNQDMYFTFMYQIV